MNQTLARLRDGVLGATRTRDLRVRSALLSPLSYEDVEPKSGIEPEASPVPGVRSTKLSYVGVAPTTGLEPAASTSGGSRSPIELRELRAT